MQTPTPKPMGVDELIKLGFSAYLFEKHQIPDWQDYPSLVSPTIAGAITFRNGYQAVVLHHSQGRMSWAITVMSRSIIARNALKGVELFSSEPESKLSLGALVRDFKPSTSLPHFLSLQATDPGLAHFMQALSLAYNEGVSSTEILTPEDVLRLLSL